MKRTEEDRHPLLPRALSLVTRELREARKMSRGELNEVSGLPLLVRIAMALNHLVTDFVEQVHKAVERSDRLRPESAIIHTSQLGKPFGPAGSNCELFV